MTDDLIARLSICAKYDTDQQEAIDALKAKDKRIAELKDEIAHLEQNFTEWLKEYRAQTDRIAALEAENKKMRLMQDEMLLMTIPVRAALEKK